jgi:uncharacterized protein with PQ loop repeat
MNLSTPEILGVIATTAGILMALAPWLQLRRIRRTGSSRDVSLLYLTLLDLGFIAWIAYGWSIGNPALLISNATSLTFMTLTIIVALAYRRRKPDAAPSPRSSSAADASDASDPADAEPVAPTS